MCIMCVHGIIQGSWLIGVYRQWRCVGSTYMCLEGFTVIEISMIFAELSFSKNGEVHDGKRLGTCLESGPTPFSPLFILYVYNNRTHCLGTVQCAQCVGILCTIIHLKYFF